MYARGLREWTRGDLTEEGEAAGRSVADVLCLIAEYISKPRSA